jgi:soluble lytic murein transglycosylase-like protein
MKRLLVSACLAGLAISGATPSAMAQSASAATETDATATTKPIFPIYPRSAANKSAATKTASSKTSGKLAKGRIPLPAPKPTETEATEADASAPEGAAQPTETQADATPADTQATEAPAAETAPAETKTAEPKTAETKPSYMRTGHPEIDALVATHARANNVPEVLVHRVIVRESKYQKDLVGSCGCIGLMQIKLATARGLGYAGDAKGLHDANTNLMYGVKYLAGAYRAANGNHDRAVQYFAKGYYEVAKRQRLAEAQPFGRSERVHAPLDITPRPSGAVPTAKHAGRAPLDKQATASR